MSSSVALQPASEFGSCNALASDAARRRGIYERMAAGAAIPETLSFLADWIDCKLPSSTAVIHHLTGSGLEGYCSPNQLEGCPMVSRGDFSCSGGKDCRTPWWHQRGQTVAIADEPCWGNQGRRVLQLGYTHCWSNHLVTSAGEVVGTVTIFLRSADDWNRQVTEVLDEVCHLSALCIEQSNLVEELRYQAQHDLLTGLWNSHYLQQAVDHALIQEQGPALAGFRLYWIYLEGLRKVNTILGGRVGDVLLMESAQRVQASANAHDIVARVGGGEFAVLARVDQDSGGEAAGERILSAFARPFEIDGHELSLMPKIGSARLDVTGADGDTIARHARTASGRAHACSGAALLAFDASMLVLTPERLELEGRLRQARERNELSLHYQPQVRMVDGLLVGVEALLRWRPADLGVVSPGVFIPLAEELGLIEEFGTWVLEEACRQGAEWERQHHPCRIGVNVSGAQFDARNFASVVERILNSSGLSPHLLELEVTESMILGNRELAIQHLNRLRSLGLTIALDDFGTGQSSLSYLLDLPLDRLKVDRSFLREINGQENPALLTNIIRMGHSLGLSVITEGVESAREWEVLQAIGSDEIQGFLLSKPLPAPGFEAWRDNRQATVSNLAE